MKELIGTYLVTRSETEMPNQRSKVSPSVVPKPGFMKDTIESKNKQRNSNFSEHKPRPPSGISSSKKSRKQRLIAPDTLKKYEEYVGMAKRFKEMHQVCLEKEEEQSQCIQDLENDIKIQQIKNVLLQKKIEKLNCSYNTMKAENAKVKYIQNEVDAKTKEVNSLRIQLVSSECLSLEIKILRREKANVEQQNSELTEALQAKTVEIESLIKHLERIETLSKECEKQGRTREKGEHEMTELEQVVQKKTNEVEELTTKIKDLSRQLTNGKRDKENAENQIDSLSNTLFHKRKELESVQNKLARSEEDVLILSKDIKDIQASRHLADEKLHGLQTENASLKSALSKATNEIDDLNKGTNLQKYKTDAEHKASKLMNALREKDTENEALREQLARAEKNVSILSKDIKDMQASKRQVAEEKLQSLQTENTSLKSALFEATNEIEDLVNKGTDLQKYKSDAEHKTSKLMNALREKDTENEALREQLASAEKNVSILSKDIKDMQASKRQVAEEKLQSLQTENTSLKSALSKATNK